MTESWGCRCCGTRNPVSLGVCVCGTPRGWQAPGVPAFSTAYVPKKGEIKKLRKEHPDLDARTAEQVVKDALTDLRSIKESGPAFYKPKLRWVPEDQRHMLELDLFDAHVGKLAWHEETGENYDADIATERIEAAVEDLIGQASHYPIEKVLIPLGNDMAHYDTLTGMTTAGTPQDRDSRYQLMYRRTFAAARRMIERAALVAPVHVIVVPGNHDALTTFTIGVALDAYFHADPRVTIENTPTPRKYIRYGTSLIGFAHGHGEPHKRYPMLMPVEVPELWAKTTWREMHVGHFHVSKVTQPVMVGGENGVRVRVIRALSGTDAWHCVNGYVGEPAGAEAFLWNYSEGLRANFISSVRRREAA